jgi:hypothetical protein
MKTFEEWEKSDIDLDVYLGEKPCEIDFELYEFIACGYVPTNCYIDMGNKTFIQQAGEANDSFEHFEKDIEIYTYSTVIQYPDDSCWYLGILPDLSLIEN